MKTLSKKLSAAASSQLFIHVSLSIASVALVAVMLYVLINSPA